MSALALFYSPNPLRMDHAAFQRMMDRLKHRGVDGETVVEFDDLLIGHCHFWTTPEEIGESQPLALPKLPYRIALDGRLDNRAEMIARLQLDPVNAAAHSDAALILLAYHHWGENCFKDLVGVFALAIYNAEKNEVIVVRDHLGDRTLFYSQKADGQVVVASEPWAVAWASETPPQPNPCTVAHFFDFSVPADGASFFEGIYELLPAHLMRITPTGIETQRYWEPDLTKKIRYKTEAEYVHHFLQLLEESIRARMRATTPVAVSMSGGLDSTSIACVAAKLAAPEKVTAISSVFDELSDCDEREYINSVNEACDLLPVHIPSDDAWALKDLSDAAHGSPNSPEQMLFPAAMGRIYQAAHTARMRVVLSGEAGDILYLAAQNWLADLLAERRFGDAFRALKKQVRAKGLRYLLKTPSFRPVLRNLVACFANPLLKICRRRPVHVKLTYLSEFAKAYLSPTMEPDVQVNSSLFGLRYAQLTTAENTAANRYGVELRFPYRDRRLVEFMSSIPAYMLYANGLHKHILRLAMRDTLPEKVRQRKKESVLDALFLRGFERETVLLEKYILGAKHVWHQFLDRQILHTALQKKMRLPLQRELFLIRAALAYEIWHHSFIEESIMR